MEEYLETNRKLEIQLILFLLDVCILSEGERGAVILIHVKLTILSPLCWARAAHISPD